MADLTTAQVAERTGVSTRTIHRMVAAGELQPASKFPGYRGGFLFELAEVRRAFPNLPEETNDPRISAPNAAGVIETRGV